MALPRRIVARLVVAVLAISLSSQLLAGEALRCAAMNRAMTSTQMQHGDDATPETSHDKYSQGSSQSSSCLISTDCLNAPAVVVSQPIAFDVARVLPVIWFNLDAPTTLSVRPDSPPPKA